MAEELKKYRIMMVVKATPTQKKQFVDEMSEVVGKEDKEHMVLVSVSAKEID